MMIESLDEYLDTLAGYVYDSDKLVTYKWLSKELEVHVNIAKQILWEFVQRRQEDTLVCTYLIMGTLNGGGVRVEVVKEADLIKAKEKYANIISEHIYSVQRTLPDISLLALSGEGDTRYSAIKCNECEERTDEELHVLRWARSSSEVQQKTNVEKPKSAHESASVVVPNTEQKTEKKTIETKKNVSAQKKGFNSLFGKASSKKSPPSKSEVSTETSPKETASSSPKKKKGGLDSFFEQGKSQQTNKKPLEQNKIDDAALKETKNDENEVKKKTPPSISHKNKKDIRGKKRNRSKDTKPVSKRLKRITVQSDSSESESNDEEQPELDPIPSPKDRSPVKNRTPSPPRVKLENGKRRVLKLVDQTFKEDGFLVTKKVHVYESCSEEEPEQAEVKKTTPPESQQEPKGKKSTKQTTLMNFFKKS